MLGGNHDITNTAATDLLYSGEQYDNTLQQQYLRARYYDQNSGRFNRLDPYKGNNFDPQSLHKYAYCHSDPVNAIDPTGMFTLAGMMSTMTTRITNGIKVTSVKVAVAWKQAEALQRILMVYSAFSNGFVNMYTSGLKSDGKAFTIGFLAGLLGGLVSFRSPTIGAGLISSLTSSFNAAFSDKPITKKVIINILIDTVAASGVAFIATGLAKWFKVIGAKEELELFFIGYDASLLTGAIITGLRIFEYI
ncbi:RHS repeat-associated core domain-containing protein [Lentisphaerota bacterium WC36G]|nr:RHS repeat-associated core domain-containing protein [Lentisphaerae bacterium WC36]